MGFSWVKFVSENVVREKRNGARINWHTKKGSIPASAFNLEFDAMEFAVLPFKRFHWERAVFRPKVIGDDVAWIGINSSSSDVNIIWVDLGFHCIR